MEIWIFKVWPGDNSGETVEETTREGGSDESNNTVSDGW